FVRFVSTPEVLESFVTIEKEIVHIEGSVQSSEAEDNHKVMLCKEQAMTCARALVARYYLKPMDDLICFADAFEASRLRSSSILINTNIDPLIFVSLKNC
ncbi:hypothetical protein RYX36_037283, partial [Vicia faba]